MPFSFQFCKQCGTDEPHRDGRCIGRNCFTPATGTTYIPPATLTSATTYIAPAFPNITPMQNAQNMKPSVTQRFVPPQQMYVTTTPMFVPSPQMLGSTTQNRSAQDTSLYAATTKGSSVSSAITSRSTQCTTVSKRKANDQLESMTISDKSWEACEEEVKAQLDAIRAKKRKTNSASVPYTVITRAKPNKTTLPILAPTALAPAPAPALPPASVHTTSSTIIPTSCVKAQTTAAPTSTSIPAPFSMARSLASNPGPAQASTRASARGPRACLPGPSPSPVLITNSIYPSGRIPSRLHTPSQFPDPAPVPAPTQAQAQAQAPGMTKPSPDSAPSTLITILDGLQRSKNTKRKSLTQSTDTVNSVNLSLQSEDNNVQTTSIVAINCKNDGNVTKDKPENIRVVMNWNGKFPRIESIDSQRKQSVEEAKETITNLGPEISKKRIMLKEKERLIRSLKKQLAAVEIEMSLIDSEKQNLDHRFSSAVHDSKCDEDIIIDAFLKSDIHSGNGGTQDSVDWGRSVMEDMCNVYRACLPCITDATKGKFVKLCTLIGTSKRPLTQEGAIAYLTRSVKSLSPLEVDKQALTLICCLVMNNSVTPLEIVKTPWHVIAYALALTGSFAQIQIFVKKVLAAMSHFHTLETEPDKCLILDILQPSCDALRSAAENDHTKDYLRAAADPLWKALREILLIVVSEDLKILPQNYAMPADATIAAREGSKELASFLRSPTDMVTRLNLTKVERTQVHRIIDDYIPGSSSKLSHSSKGTGGDRVLIVTKVKFAREYSAEMIMKKAVRQQEYCRLLENMVE